ncbi:unnamed protein product [Gongylonema pulchrum]|uniref:Uncharacterized protein n=1 Tax=Gongylonema pulchrum TaxID=637853 RepID=A0A183DNZ7_9BILA|nr:unnamed protein product [Gongylonema pulchrum]
MWIEHHLQSEIWFECVAGRKCSLPELAVFNRVGVERPVETSHSGAFSKLAPTPGIPAWEVKARKLLNEHVVDEQILLERQQIELVVYWLHRKKRMERDGGQGGEFVMNFCGLNLKND